MAGNDIFTGQDGNIYVDFDVQNLIVVDPNKVVDPTSGKVKDRLVDHENLVMYANLETKLIPRTKLAVGTTTTDRIQTVSIAEINFMKPGGQTYLTNEYTNEITGEGILNRGTTNKAAASFTPSTGQKPTASVGQGDPKVSQIDTGLLGITQINCRINTSFIPEVTIELEDIQGRALFEKGDLSPYAAFFQLPYPPFFLTLKGYYGKAVRYQLNLISFSARFNTFSGNYQVSLTFYGYKFNILNEISLGCLFAVPHMYGQQYTVSRKLSNTTNSAPITQITEGGMAKIREVYQDYKSKGLLPKDFPELSVPELLNRLELFEQNLQNSWTKADVLSITESKKYLQTLRVYLGSVYANPDSWFETNCDKKKAVIKKNTGETLYPLNKINKEGTTNQGANTEQATDADLQKLIIQYNDELNGNAVFGKSGKLPIEVTITDKVMYELVGLDDIDYEATYKLRNGINSTPSEFQIKEFTGKLQIELGIKLLNSQTQADPSNTEDSDDFEGENEDEFEATTNSNKKDPQKIRLYVFEGVKRFKGLIDKLAEDCRSKAQKEEERLTALLAARFEDKAQGVGFKPSIKNVIAVILASTEAFIRLMDDTHKNAWDVRNDPDRKRAVLKYPSSDAKDNVVITDKENLTPIYPWPQYFVESNQNGQKYVIKYPGDRDVIDTTKGYDYKKWPEVQFCEEFFKGYLERTPQVTDTTEKDNETQTVERITLNALEFPQTNLPYYAKEEVKFLYEIWERTYMNSHYNRFQRGGNVKEIYELIGRNESENIITALGTSSPYLSNKLKNYGFNFQNYLGVLSHISNAGAGPSIQKLIRDIFATPYIQTEVDSNFGIFDESVVSPDAPTQDQTINQTDFRNIEDLIKTNVEPDFCDTYPFTDEDWLLFEVENSAQSIYKEFYNTKKTIFLNPQKKVLSNFVNTTTNEEIRPVTSFAYKNFSVPIVPNGQLNLFYTEREELPRTFLTTEGRCINPALGKPALQTTSILNTPFFTNALLNGVQDWKAKKDNPFVQGAYLLVNSLPLSTLRGTYKTRNQLQPLDYIASSLKRFGGVHKLPYPWILKIGSLYHRYRRFVNEGVDILDTCWTNFNYVNNFDPITNDVNKNYQLRFDGANTVDVFLQKETQAQIMNAPYTFQTIQAGFYPKLINDMNYFFNGADCFTTYSNVEIQLFVDSNMKVGNIESGNVFEPFVSGGSSNFMFEQRSWSAVIKNSSAENYYTIPSFGSAVQSQVSTSIFNSDNPTGENTLELTILNNPAIFNGTVRNFWASPNYGYFDITSNRKPRPTEYMTLIRANGTLSPFEFGLEYSSIEEIFSVFNKEQLELMEKKFLDFCVPVYDIKDVVGPGERKITLNVDVTDPNRYLKNFQLMVREFFQVLGPVDLSIPDYLKSLPNKQFGNIITILNNFMEYNIVMKIGNPSMYDRRLFDSFLPDYETGYEFTSNQNGPTTQVPFYLRDPYTFSKYVTGSLPTKNGSVTLTQSITSNTDAWNELRLQLGPTTIPQLNYTDNGSFITDFFVDNDIAFTKENVKICAPLIRIYATQKLKNNNLNKTSFQDLLQQYSDKMLDYHKNVLNNLFENLRKNLPDYNFLPEGTVKSRIEGDLVKAQYYEMFKAINDKWIAGNAYNEDTLFQDFIFVDRASRNVGDQIFVDIYVLKNKLRNLNLNASVFTLVGSILTESHFSVMPLPAYVNFYNIQTPDGTTGPKLESSYDFANSLWGTFLSVDYRKSGPKLVCFYAEKPSNYPDLGRNKDFRYKNDGFACNSLTDNALLENQEGKTDWAISNRCVGFNVDMGLRNQNVFYSFSVAQDTGTATAESLIATNQLGNQASGRQVTSQNVSLLNIYNERSYTCNVVALGNALIQPTMYFCLNHVPMFNGAYMIIDVTHTIQPGNFQTSFTGVRQRVFDTIRPNDYLLSLNQNLLQKLPDLLKEPQSAPSSGEAIQTSDKTNAGPNTCQESVTNGPVQNYRKEYVAVEANQTEVTTQVFAKTLADKLTSSSSDQKIRSQVAMMVYAISFVSSSDNQGTKFKSFGNNYANITLERDWKALDKFFEKQFCCVNIQTDKNKDNSKNKLKTKPFVRFTKLDNFIQMMLANMDPVIQGNQSKIETESSTSYIPKAESLYQLYSESWPVIRDKKQQEDFGKNQGKEVLEKIKKAISSIKSIFPSVGIPVNGQPNATQTVTNAPAGQTVNQNNTPNANDRNILSTAISAYTLNVSTLSSGFLKIEGNVGTSALSKEYTIKLSLVSFGGTQEVSVPIGETILKAGTFGQINGYSFTSDKSFRQTCSDIVNKINRSISFRIEIKEYPEYKFLKSYKVMKYDCPTRNLLPGDVVTDQIYNEIDANPCGICYPSGGRNIIINGKDCLPNTAPINNIFDITTTKQGNKIASVKFTIKPNVGLWKIFASKDFLVCGQLTGSESQRGDISSDFQSISYDVTRIINDSCEAGKYTLILEPYADPRTSGGQMDPTREQISGKYIVEGIK